MNNVSGSRFVDLQGVLHEVCVTGEKVGATAEIYGALAHSEELFAFIVEKLSDEPACAVSVNDGQPWEEMISDCLLDHVNDGVSVDDFPPEGTFSGSREIVVHLKRCSHASRTRVLEEIEEQGFRPATTPEFLAVGSQHPEMQKWYTIIAPRDQQSVLVLKSTNMTHGGVELHRVMYKFLMWRGWNLPTIRYALVRK